MHELNAEDFHLLTPLLDGLHAGTEIMGAVLSGHTRGRIFVPQAGDLRTAFVYDNGFCVLAGDWPDTPFATACLDWLQGSAHRDFFILYPGHAGWEPVLDQRQVPNMQKLQRVGFSFDRSRFAAQRAEQPLPPGLRLVPMDIALLRQLAEGPYPFAAGMWASDAQFERDGIGFCVLHEGRIASLCYSVFVNDRRHDVDICTFDGYRRRGLARAAATAFIDGCLRRGLEPGWDCFKGNRASYELAQALGFKPVHEFAVYSWNLSS
ncbi:GNAT family N-acetyltransferase [Acidovorax sp. LjRoot66]|uniref:GNAT family N-acetyltransferase n=1 Tax=Acidovorax sp. LjRoot66 TaxID=3342334 RepID=UPI003ECC52B0